MSDNERTNAIEVRGVTKRFGTVVALDDISFSVKRGELFFLLGPSGCGKTTMLRILAGLETPDGGTILSNGEDIEKRPPHKRGVPMVFQNYALWPHMSVFENIAFGLVERRVSKAEIRERVSATLDRVELTGLDERMPGQLSGGQQQRVVLARALVLSPDAVLLDEPLSNLDAKLRSEMREEIEHLHTGTDITFIYVTHDQVEALSLADRMAVMENGRIRAIGTPESLYRHPPSLFCAIFLGEANTTKGTVRTVDGDQLTVETDLGVLRGVCPEGNVSTGDPIHCIIRPENVRLGESDLDNKLEATIKSSRMTGATITVQLETMGTMFRAVLLNEAGARLEPNTRLTLGFNATDTVIVNN